VGRVVNKYKVAKYFIPDIENDSFNLGNINLKVGAANIPGLKQRKKEPILKYAPGW